MCSAITGPLSTLLALSYENFTLRNQDVFRGDVAYIPFFLAFIFFLRGRKVWKKQRDRHRAEVLPITRESQSIDQVSQVVSNGQGYVLVQPANNSMHTSSYSLFVEEKENGTHRKLLSVARVPESIYTKIESLPIDVENKDIVQMAISEDEMHIDVDSITDSQSDESRSPNSQSHSESNETESMNEINEINETPIEFFSVMDAIERMPQREVLIRSILTSLIMLFIGALTGIVYFGGGMLFSVAIMSLWNTKQLVATGTSCFIMFCTMCCVSTSFIGRQAIFTINTLELIVISIPFSILGCWIGAKLLVRISELAMYITTSVFLFILGLVITFQSRIAILSPIEP